MKKWILVIAGVVGWFVLCILFCSVFMKFCLGARNSEVFAFRIRENSQIVSVSFKRLSFCSLEDFPGITKSGLRSAEGHVAVSRDLSEYVGGYLYLSGEMYMVTDLMNKRYRRSVDVYVDFSHKETMALGIHKNVVGYFVLLPFHAGSIE